MIGTFDPEHRDRTGVLLDHSGLGNPGYMSPAHVFNPSYVRTAKGLNGHL